MHAQETTIYNAILLTGILLGLIIILFLLSIIRQHRKHVKLYKLKIEAEITTLENERTRIAADLHDELGPILSAAKFKLATIEDIPENEIKLITQATAYIDDIILRMRQISYDLMPSALVRKGAVAGIKEFIHNIGFSFPVKINLTIKDIPELDLRKAIHLYRIVQEIVHNTIKHSGAGELEIILKYERQRIILISRDNGHGFDYETESKEHSGLGLRNLLSRAEVLGGEMFVTSKTGKGTMISIEIPYHI